MTVCSNLEKSRQKRCWLMIVICLFYSFFCPRLPQASYLAFPLRTICKQSWSLTVVATMIYYIQVELLREQMCIHICSVMISQTTVTSSLHHLYITEKNQPTTKKRHGEISTWIWISQKSPWDHCINLNITSSTSHHFWWPKDSANSRPRPRINRHVAGTARPAAQEPLEHQMVREAYL